MSKKWSPAKPTVELRPSRIRREPTSVGTPVSAAKKVPWYSDERETWIVVVGVLLFALALTAITVGFGAVTSWGDAGPPDRSATARR